MLASTIQFTTNPPTPTHNPRQPGAPDGSGNQGALPQNPDSMPPPHAPSTRGHPPPADHHDHKAAAAHHSGRVSYTKHHNQPTPHSETSRPRLPCDSPSRPAQTHTAQTTNDQKTTDTQLPIPRKEVIQPHLPVRLPCYDFVPITSPTFDRSPWGHGLRVLPTFMT